MRLFKLKPVQKTLTIFLIMMLGCMFFAGCGVEDTDSASDDGTAQSEATDEGSTDYSDDSLDELLEKADQAVKENAPSEDTVGVDVDLTDMSSTMVYSEVYNMVNTPEDYVGKVIKLDGLFATTVDENNGNRYFACIVQDATACCSQGIEFVLKGDHTYPDDYPEVEEEIVLVGTFDTYYEDDYMYCTLRDAEMIEG